MDELLDALQEIAHQLRDLNDTLTRMDDGLFHLNLHIGADVSPWTGRGASAQPSSLDMTSGRHAQGLVKWYDAVKGVGFIRPTGGGPDVFVRASVVPSAGHLKEGQRVAFIAVEGTRGPMATALEIG
jgi:CspA family cold shock protein